MTFAMSPTERETFLAGVHVAVLSVDDPGHGPLTVPVWYAYEPGGTLDVVTGRDSHKARCLRAAGRFSLCAQNETRPYGYVSVEGRIAAILDPVPPGVRQAMAYRYLGQEFGDLYLAATEEREAEQAMFRLAPERWRSTDYAKQYG